MSEKNDGVGTDGTIPGHPDGVAAGATPGDPSTFEPEEEGDEANAKSKVTNQDEDAPGMGVVDGGAGGNEPDIQPYEI